MKVRFLVVGGQFEILPTIMLSLCTYDDELDCEVEDCSLWIGWLIFHVIFTFNK